MSTSAPGKADLRRAVRQRRSALTAAERAAASTELDRVVPALAGNGPVALYASFGTEPDTGPLRALLAGRGHPVLLPVLLPGGDLDWVRDGAPEVRLGPEAVATCPLVVVPALAVDLRGTRLGRGGGSYDRALARVTGLVVAALHTGDLVGTLPAEPHDRPVDAVVLPGRGLVRLP